MQLQQEYMISKCNAGVPVSMRTRVVRDPCKLLQQLRDLLATGTAIHPCFPVAHLRTLKMWVASFLCQYHSWPSTAKIPPPRICPRLCLKVRPFTKLWLLVFSTYSRFSGLVTTKYVAINGTEKAHVRKLHWADFSRTTSCILGMAFKTSKTFPISG